MRSYCRDDGVALVMALAVLALLAAFGVGILLTSSSEIAIAGSFRERVSALYAADAIAARAIDELATVPDWDALLMGSLLSTLIDGAPAGTRTLPDGATLDLAQAVNLANCQKPSPCSASDVTAVAVGRPWGPSNPRWQLYAYGPLRNMLPASDIDPPWYVILFVGDDPLQASSVIALRAEAFGTRSSHAVIELLAARSGGGDTDYNGSGQAAVNILSWREVR
jgi:hypothetical protein